MLYHPRKKKKKERVFELSDASRPRLSDTPLRIKDSKTFPEDELEFEVSFLEGILKDDPYHEDTLIFLGNAYTHLGRCEEGLEIDKRIVAIRPDDATAFYNLACSYSLLDQTENALDALEKAVEKGYSDVAHMLQDPDLANVREAPCFEEILRKIAKE